MQHLLKSRRFLFGFFIAGLQRHTNSTGQARPKGFVADKIFDVPN
jgi:hypothetical protein